jgi:hypothetical protein
VGVLGTGAFSRNKVLLVYLLSQASRVAVTSRRTVVTSQSQHPCWPAAQRLTLANKDSWTPLHAAVANGAKPVVLLLDNGVDLNAKAGLKKETPFQIGIKHRYDEIAALLQKRMKRYRSRSPLPSAAPSSGLSAGR